MSNYLLVAAPPSLVSDRATRLRQHDFLLFTGLKKSSLSSSRQLEKHLEFMADR